MSASKGFFETASQGGAQWVDVTHPLVNTTNSASVAWGANLWVAVGGAGSIATSPDGTTWTSRTNPFGPTDSLDSIGFGNGLFVVVTFEAKIATSPDGITWTLRTSPFTGGPFHSVVAYGAGAGLWVAFRGNKYATSPDGITWTLQSAYTFSSLFGLDNLPDGKHLIYDGTRFVVTLVASNNTKNTVAYSTDGINWTETDVGAMGFTTNAAGGLAYDGSALYIVGQGDRTAHPTVDGKSGAAVTSFPTSFLTPMPGGGGSVSSIAYGASTWIMLTEAKGLASSPDGVTWTAEAFPASFRDPNVDVISMTSAAAGNGQFIAIGQVRTFSPVEWVTKIILRTPSADVQTFTSSGTWIQPAGAAADLSAITEIILYGGGGGGASGTAANNISIDSASNGGGGGAGGGFLDVKFLTRFLSATEAVVVGAGGAGRAGVVRSTAGTSVGTNGGDGGSSSFGVNKAIAGGGGGGTNGGGSGANNANSTTSSTIISNVTGGLGGRSSGSPLNGGAGGLAGNGGGAGGRGGTIAGTAVGTNGTNGGSGAAGGAGVVNSSAAAGVGSGGSGGGGSGANVSLAGQTAGNGAAGVRLGDGGGGGGSASCTLQDNAPVTSGSSGAGVGGWVQVITTYRH